MNLIINQIIIKSNEFNYSILTEQHWRSEQLF
jgi:hypothetical protein